MRPGGLIPFDQGAKDILAQSVGNLAENAQTEYSNGAGFHLLKEARLHVNRYRKLLNRYLLSFSFLFEFVSQAT